MAVAEDFAQRTQAFEIPELVLGQLGRFLLSFPVLFINLFRISPRRW